MCLGFNHRIKNQTQLEDQKGSRGKKEASEKGRHTGLGHYQNGRDVMLKTDDQDDDDMLGYGLLSWPLLRPPVCVVMMINSSFARIT